jgi:transcription antitermination factor NusG
MYPDDLLNEPTVGPTPRKWFVLHVKARQEKALARELFARKIPFYLPLIKKATLARGRRRTSFSPLFGGYVFLHATEDERLHTLMTNRVVQVLPVEAPERLVCDLRQICQLIATNVPLTVESRMMPGQRVSVRQGAFAGMKGVVLKRRGETRLLVSIDFLQQGASFEIEDFLLDPIVC